MGKNTPPYGHEDPAGQMHEALTRCDKHNTARGCQKERRQKPQEEEQHCGSEASNCEHTNRREIRGSNKTSAHTLRIDHKQRDTLKGTEGKVEAGSPQR